MNYPSRLIEEAVENFAKLPGIGKKTALRLVLKIIEKDISYTDSFTRALKELKEKIKECKICHNLSDHEVCNICNDPARSRRVICVVQSIKDVMAIEETGQFSGKYHVLGGVISPIEGIGKEDINIDSLINRVGYEASIEELIMALSPSVDGDTTIYYISKLLENKNIKISTIARGISFGGELEYADGFTLGRSILQRLPFHKE